MTNTSRPEYVNNESTTLPGRTPNELATNKPEISTDANSLPALNQLAARGNSSTRISAMLQMQQSHGNLATNRYIQRDLTPIPTQNNQSPRTPGSIFLLPNADANGIPY